MLKFDFDDIEQAENILGQDLGIMIDVKQHDSFQ